MQFSENWLRTFVSPNLNSDALGHLLTMAGLELEELDPVAPAFSGVVVAEILSAEKHPNADKLRVCRVNVGEGEPLQIVCGAPNAAAGLKIPCAKVGAVLPGDFKIKDAKLRGVESFGMLCSAKELGVTAENDGLLELPADAPVGTSIRDYLALDDQLFTIKLTPNRADCLSLLGIAREVAALTDSPLHTPAITSASVDSAISGTPAVTLSAPQACPRYHGRLVRGVNAKAATPAWMKQRLERSGLRSISCIVDITNYVLLELGQPMHAFDAAKIHGNIDVRFAQGSESLTLLNDQNVTPSAKTLVIADEQGPLALAGIMGGKASSVSDDTQDIFLESAFFTPHLIAGRARELGFSSDSSYRFERGVDFNLAPQAMERATQLILDICGGTAGPVISAINQEHLPTQTKVCLRQERVSRVLGIQLNADQIGEIFTRLGLPFTVDTQGNFEITSPSYRFDIQIEEDLIEEIARVYGYDNIPAAIPQAPLAILMQAETQKPVNSVRHFLASQDFQEVINFAFVDESWEADFSSNQNPIRLANPIASQMNVMRSSLIGGLIANLATNLKRKTPRVRLFEIGRIFNKQANGNPVEGFDQPVKLGLLIAGSSTAEQWGQATRPVDFFDLKADVENLLTGLNAEFIRSEHPALHPGRSACVLINGVSVGFIGELHPTWVQKYELTQAPIVAELTLDSVSLAKVPAYQEVSRFPQVTRDLALVAPQTLSAGDLISALTKANLPLVQSVNVFDIYQGKGIEPGFKSVAIRIQLQDPSRTLEDAEVDATLQSLTDIAVQQCGAHLRV